MNDKLVNLINEVGDAVFVSPSKLYSYNDLIISGVCLSGSKKHFPVESNTFRGFHRESKDDAGASKVFREFFSSTETKEEILERLHLVQNGEELNDLSNEIRNELIDRFEEANNFDMDEVMRFNKLRKPVDLVIEHLVAMCSDLNESRERLVPFLFVPLDSWILSSGIIFEKQERRRRGPAKNNYSAVEERHHSQLQTYLNDNLQGLKYRIYFDLFWSYRFARFTESTKNLYHLNP